MNYKSEGELRQEKERGFIDYYLSFADSKLSDLHALNNKDVMKRVKEANNILTKLINEHNKNFEL